MRVEADERADVDDEIAGTDEQGQRARVGLHQLVRVLAQQPHVIALLEREQDALGHHRRDRAFRLQRQRRRLGIPLTKDGLDGAAVRHGTGGVAERVPTGDGAKKPLARARADRRLSDQLTR